MTAPSPMAATILFPWKRAYAVTITLSSPGPHANEKNTHMNIPTGTFPGLYPPSTAQLNKDDSEHLFPTAPEYLAQQETHTHGSFPCWAQNQALETPS